MPEFPGVRTSSFRSMNSRRPDAAFGGAPFPVQQLQLGKPQQVAGGIHALSDALLGHRVVLTQESWQPQRFQMMFQQHLGRGHRRTPGPSVS